MADSSA